jgi:two-component system, LuxR family, sensor kinase FixL
MSWITVIWAMAASACVTMALPHLAIWVKRRSEVTHLLFALSALGAGGNALAELWMLKATTVEGYAAALRVDFVPLVLLAIAMTWYVRSYFGTGRRSLAVAVTIAWLLVLIVDAFSPFSPVFSGISGLRIMPTPWGEQFALANGVIHPLNLVISVADLIFLVFVVDASVAFWRRGERRRAVFFGVGIVGGSLVAVIVARIIDFGVLQIPYVTTFVYLGIIALFGYPLSLDVLRTAQFARQLQESEAELRESEARINLAADAANLGLWVWNIRDDELWVTEKWRRLFGFAESEPVSVGQLLQLVHPEDRERIKQNVQDMREGRRGGDHESEYRITRPDGSIRWIAGYGGVELDEHGKPAFARGVSRDITKGKLAEAALRETEASIKLAANAANLGLWAWDIRNDQFLVTEKWRRLFGFAESEPVDYGRWLQLVHPEDRERMKQTVQDMIEHGGGERESEYRITRPDGSVRWISGYGGVELDESGKPAFTRGVSRDITKRKVAEDELRESEARFRTVADAAPVLIWMAGPDKLCTFFNKGWLDFTGRTIEQELGNGWAEGIHSDDLERCLETYGSSFDAWQPFTMEYRLRRNDGEYRWVLDSGTAHFANDGAFLGYIGSCIDITEQKRAEEKFRIVLDAAPNAMIMADSAGVISFANASAATVFGYSLSELIGQPIETLLPERFRDRDAGYRKGFHSEPSSRAMGAGRDLFGRRKDGSEFPVEVGLNPIRTAEGLFVLASVIDITARKQAELEHQLQNTELARVGRVAVMGELAASLAHEVNNPIGAMVANASAGQRLLAAGKIGVKELTELLSDIVADGRRAGEVIQGIRNMVRKGAARRSLIPTEDTIRQLLRIVHADAIGREVKVTAKVDSDAGLVWGDPVQLLQVLLNLALNALEAMSVMRPDARRLVIRAGRDGNGDILVSLRDSGPGFPSGMAEQLFEPFFSTKADGTGMGLSISRSIIEAHGGTLSGENCDGGGACFTVRLPQAKDDNSQAA